MYIYTYIMKSRRQSNAPILLITAVALWQHAGYGRPVAEFTHCWCSNQQSAQQALSNERKYID